MRSPLVCAQRLEMLSEGEGCRGRSSKGRITARGPFHRFRDLRLWAETP